MSLERGIARIVLESKPDIPVWGHAVIVDLRQTVHETSAKGSIDPENSRNHVSFI